MSARRSAARLLMSLSLSVTSSWPRSREPELCMIAGRADEGGTSSTSGTRNLGWLCAGSKPSARTWSSDMLARIEWTSTLVKRRDVTSSFSPSLSHSRSSAQSILRPSVALRE